MVMEGAATTENRHTVMVGVAAHEVGEVVTDDVGQPEVEHIAIELHRFGHIRVMKVDVTVAIRTKTDCGRAQRLYPEIDLEHEIVVADECEAFADVIVQGPVTHDLESCLIDAPANLLQCSLVPRDQADVVDRIVLRLDVDDFVMHICSREVHVAALSFGLPKSQDLSRIEHRILESPRLNGDVTHFGNDSPRHVTLLRCKR